MAHEILEVDGLNSFYGGSHILHDIEFTLKRGTLLGLLGRNGAGKTTTLSSLMGFVRSSRGRIRLEGRSIAGLPSEAISKSGLGLVPQGRRIFRSLSVKENLLVAVQDGRSEVEKTWTIARVFEVFPRLAERQGQTAGLMSGGEQQMLAIGRALVGNPKVLLMDEPSEGLAPQIVAELGKTIGWLRDDGLSIILVEQNLKLAFELSDKIIMLNTGRVAYQGSSSEAVKDEGAINRNLGVF